jgi:hypothetical protein
MAITLAARRAFALPLLALACACADRDALLPKRPTAPSAAAALECTVVVATQQMHCGSLSATPSGVRADIVGGQDVYVKMASSGTAYDSGTQILSSSVTVQNLLQKEMGTTDGVAVTGVRVFFQSINTTGGNGTVTVATDSVGTFMNAVQPYYVYNEILQPYEISSAQTWQFNVPSTVTTFSFRVYTSADTYGGGASALGPVWTGAVDSLWSNASNWSGGLPDSTSTVSIPADSLLSSHRSPVLTADVDVGDLRVGYGSTLGLKGFTARVRGNVDAVGSVTGGTLWTSGTGALLDGNVNALLVSGSSALQAATKATGAVSVTGSVNVKDHALTISIP